MNKLAKLPILLLSLILASLACKWVAAPKKVASPADLYTQAADTLQAQYTNAGMVYAFATMTALARGSLSTPTAMPAYPTPIPPSATNVIPTVTPIPSATPLTTATSQSAGSCNRATFVKDITVSDGAVFLPGSQFTKVWRLKNSGSCSWDKKYALLYIGGDTMGSPKSYPINSEISPGEIVDIQVELVAPTNSGKYTSYWMLMDPSSQLFGIGEQGKNSLWVTIKVSKPNNNYAYDFATNMCLAAWSSSDGGLRCPGDIKSPSGSIAYLGKPNLEDGRHENEPALWTRPETIKGGWIKGVYPPYKVKAKDHFIAEIGCLEGYPDCKVTFALDYQIAGKPLKHIGEWYQAYDKNIALLDIDLSDLAGKSVQFILKVTNNGKPAQGNAFWFVPSIRQVTAPTPTRTPTATPTLTSPAPPTSTPTVTQTPAPPPVETVTPTLTPT